MTIGYIYRIKHKVLNLYYYGSTIQTLKERWGKHMDSYKHKGDISIYKYFDLFNVEDFYIHFVDLVKFENKDDLLEREQWFIDNFGCVNDRNAWGCNLKRKKENKKKYMKQYRNENKDRIREKDKEHYEKNKDKIRERQKKYRDENKDRLNENSRKYRVENKDRLDEYIKEYYEKNKEKISKKRKEKIKCECGVYIVRSVIAKHRRTKKHLNLLEKKV